jgi:MarR family transcriptional regulator, organic hydroperoxide resistance regulator
MNCPADYRAGVTEQRRDLAEMLTRLAYVFTEAERPVLDEQGVTMWEYVVLLALREGPARSQARLAELSGRDKTRLIPILDSLAASGLVSREPDPADRRNRIVGLTDAGRTRVEACREGIRVREAGLLADLPAADRAAFVRRLHDCADQLTPWP